MAFLVDGDRQGEGPGAEGAQGVAAPAKPRNQTAEYTRQTMPVETVIEGFKEAYDWVADTVPVIGVLGYVGKPIVWKAALGNVDTSLPTQRIGGFRAERLYTFYWKS